MGRGRVVSPSPPRAWGPICAAINPCTAYATTETDYPARPAPIAQPAQTPYADKTQPPAGFAR